MRYRDYLLNRYRGILGYAGIILFAIGLSFLLPLLVLPFYPEEAGLAGNFLLPGAILVILGVVSWRRLIRPETVSLNMAEGMVVVVLVWTLVCLLGALPFMLVTDLNFTQAIFESVSGWTSTGLSIVDVEAAPRMILLYRSITQTLGGAGFVIIALAAVTGPAGAGLSAAEGRSEQLAPHVRQSASIVVRMLVIYTIFGIVALRLAGMGWFDAVNHALTAISTGGFSTRAESIGYWDSPQIEGVMIVLMLVGSLNFLAVYTFARGKFGAVFQNGELRLMLLVLPTAALLVFLVVTLNVYESVGKSARVAIFETTSAISTAGFSTVSYGSWSSFGWLILIGVMLVGGGSGSTAGGIKQFRVYILWKAVIWELRRAFMPQHSVNEPAIWQGDQRSLLTDNRVRRVALFVFLFMMVYFVGVGVMTAYGYPLQESLFEFASTLSTVGLSSGITAMDAPVGMLWMQSFAMLLGRLEILAVFIGIIKLVTDARVLFRNPTP